MYKSKGFVVNQSNYNRVVSNVFFGRNFSDFRKLLNIEKRFEWFFKSVIAVTAERHIKPYFSCIYIYYTIFRYQTNPRRSILGAMNTRFYIPLRAWPDDGRLLRSRTVYQTSCRRYGPAAVPVVFNSTMNRHVQTTYCGQRHGHVNKSTRLE